MTIEKKLISIMNVVDMNVVDGNLSRLMLVEDGNEVWIYDLPEYDAVMEAMSALLKRINRDDGED